MPVFRLDDRLVFPPVHLAEDGLVAVGGDLRVERLLLGYRQGIFPWYSDDLPILWHSPEQRMMMTTHDLRINRSLRKSIRRAPYQLKIDTAFVDVLTACAQVPRPGQQGTWLVPDMLAAYTDLHRQGFAHSFEAWDGATLVGGLYGVSIGGAFFGESMFARAPEASKIAFVASVRQLNAWRIGLIDCQVHTEHLERFGAYEVPRLRYIEMLKSVLDQPTRRGRWNLELDMAEFIATGGGGDDAPLAAG
ncbi:MAG: leucyl/phenylalanyl-tRNA--protein transferase [Kofleriaceae bacterium]|nr:leucyl/phenylalanyl-tRNA--protein transferase [Kofleriaceae bacterium]